MKKQMVLLALLGWTSLSIGQTALQNCVQDNLVREDSTKNHADRMMMWIDCVQGKTLPSFTVTTLADEKIKSKKLEGKIIVVNLWFIDCLPCIKELPALNKLVSEYGNRKDVIFLSLTWESKERIEKEFFAKYKLDFKVVPDAMKVVELFGKPGYPVTFVIGRDQQVKGAWLGGPIDESANTEAYKRVKPVLDELLAKAE